jgi:hypothetical protein
MVALGARGGARPTTWGHDGAWRAMQGGRGYGTEEATAALGARDCARPSARGGGHGGASVGSGWRTKRG